MRSARTRADMFAKLDRIAQRRKRYTFSVVAPTTFRGWLVETLTALRETLR